MSNDDKPPEHPTAQIPKAEILIGELKSITEIGFRQVNTNIDLVANEVRRAHSRIDGLEGRVSSHSGGVRELRTETIQQSKHDLEQDAELAKERAAREELASKVDTLLAIGARLDAAMKHPLFKLVGFFLLTAVTSYLASHGIKVPQ